MNILQGRITAKNMFCAVLELFDRFPDWEPRTIQRKGRVDGLWWYEYTLVEEAEG